MTQSITKEIQNGVATLTLNRPEVFNSFNREMALLLQDQLDACEKDEAVRAIILTGNGKAFVQDRILARLPTRFKSWVQKNSG